MYDVKYPLISIGFFMFVAVVLAACDDIKPVSIEAASSIKNVPGLQDCQAYKGMIDSRNVTIVRCPNSSTSVAESSGKTIVNSVTIDDTILAINEWEESKKKLDERIKELQAAQKEYDNSVAKLRK